VIETPDTCVEIARTMKGICAELGLNYVFKASFDKANRTSVKSFRGPGLKAGLEILEEVGRTVDVPLVTDVHEPDQIDAVAAVVDILQIPAFLCRQTDLLVAAGHSGCTVNIKKGQFIAPGDMRPALDKVHSTGNDKVMLTERGTTFGYRNLVVDMRGLAIMRELGVPVIFDGTHSVQLPGGQGESSGGQREFVAPLVRAAAGIGVDGFFLETHPDPSVALSDGPNTIALADMKELLSKGRDIDALVR
jgi:2-dehydro-3-deoxyphosphooctonate aldolase (KDO 8-P synthase)